MSIGTHYITVGLDVSRQIKEAQRLADRRSNAIDVLEEAAAEMARQYQIKARACRLSATSRKTQAIKSRSYGNQKAGNKMMAMGASDMRQAEKSDRLARRYLLALVGDGRGEE